MIASRFSLAPFGEPGKVIKSDLFLTPATGRDIIANGVTLREVASMPCLNHAAHGDG